MQCIVPLKKRDTNEGKFLSWGNLPMCEVNCLWPKVDISPLYLNNSVQCSGLSVSQSVRASKRYTSIILAAPPSTSLPDLDTRKQAIAVEAQSYRLKAVFKTSSRYKCHSSKPRWPQSHLASYLNFGEICEYYSHYFSGINMRVGGIGATWLEKYDRSGKYFCEGDLVLVLGQWAGGICNTITRSSWYIE